MEKDKTGGISYVIRDSRVRKSPPARVWMGNYWGAFSVLSYHVTLLLHSRMKCTVC